MPRKAFRVRIAVVFVALALCAFAAVKFVSYAHRERLMPLPVGVNVTATDTLAEKAAGDGNADPGEVLSGTITATNSGTTATGVTVTTTLPSELTLDPASVKTSPVAADDSYSAPSGTLTINTAANGILGNDFGLPAPTITVGACGAAPVTNCATANGGTVSVNADGTFSFTKKAGDTGPDTFTYTLANGITPPNPADAAATVSISLAPNQPPVITSDGGGATFSKSIAENTTAVTTVTATDADSGPSPISYSIFGGADSGKFSINPTTGVLTFTSAPDFDIPGDADANNQYIVVVQAWDGQDVDQQTITVTVTNVNEAPLAHNDTATAVEAGGVANGTAGTDIAGFNVITGTGTGSVADTDPDAGDTISIKGVAVGNQGATVLSTNVGVGLAAASPNDFGTLTLASGGGYTYVVNNGNAKVQALRTSAQTLTDTFTYTLKDAAGLTSNATITITIQGANDNPVAVADVASATEASGTNNGTAGIDPSGNVLTNDTDVDTLANGETKAVDAVLAGTNTGAQIATACPTTCNVGAGLSTSNNYGTLTLQSDGSYTYVVNQTSSAVQALNSAGTLADVFTYRVKDAAGATSVTTITVTINGADDFAIASNDSATMSEDAAATAIPVLTNDTDPDSATKTIGGKTDGAHGTVVITGGGSGLTYTPAANYCNDLNGTAADTFTYTLTPGSSQATVTVTVTCVNDPPVAENKPTSGTIDVMANMKRTGINASLLTNVTDADSGVSGCSPTFSVASITSTASTHGTISAVNLAAGTFDFDPDPGYTGASVLNYTVSDNGCPASATSAAKTITLNVIGPVIWFVNQGGGGSNLGTLANPFNNLAAGNTAMSTNASQRIFVYSGTTASGVGVTLTGAATQPTAQWLIGQGVITNATDFDSVMAISPPSGTIARPGNTAGGNNTGTNGTRPTIQGTVTLGNNTVVRGLNITTTGATPAMADAAGSITTTVNSVALTTATGAALTLSDVTSSTLTFDGITTAGGAGVSLTGTNTSSTFDFSNVIISSGANGGFVATGGGTVTVTGAANTLASTTGTALNVSNTTIGANGLTFKSISTTGAVSDSVIVDGTGTTAGLTVTGTGTTAGSGGIINHAAGGADLSTTVGIGVYLNNTKNVSLNNMNFTGTFSNYGIFGKSVDTFTLINTDFTGGTYGTQSANGNYEGVVTFGSSSGTDGTGNGLTGTASFQGNNFANAYAHTVGIFNNYDSSKTLAQNALVLNFGTTTANTLGAQQTAGAHIAEDALQVQVRGNGTAQGQGFNLTANIGNTTAGGVGNNFNWAAGDMLQVNSLGNSTSNINVTNNNFINASTIQLSGGGGVTLSQGGTGSVVTYNVNKNIFKRGTGFELNVAPLAISGTSSGVIQNNTIGQPDGTYQTNTNNPGGVATYGLGGVGGIWIHSEKGGSSTQTCAVRIENNQIGDYSGNSGIVIWSNNAGGSGGSQLVEATLKNNIVKDPSSNNGFTSLEVDIAGSGTPGDNGKVGLSLSGNTFDNGGATNGDNAIDLLTGPTGTFFVDHYAGAHTGAALTSYLTTVSANVPVVNTLINGGFPNTPSSGVDTTGNSPGSTWATQNFSLAVPAAPAFVGGASVAFERPIPLGITAEIGFTPLVNVLGERASAEVQPKVTFPLGTSAEIGYTPVVNVLGGNAKAELVKSTESEQLTAHSEQLGNGSVARLDITPLSQTTTEEKPSLMAELYNKLTASIEPTVYSKEARRANTKQHSKLLSPAAVPTICIDNDADAGCTGPGFTLPGGKSIKVVYEATVKNGPFNSGVDNLTDATTIAWTGPSAGSAQPTTAGSIALDAAPDLSVTASDSATSTQPGVTIPYTISYGNTHAPDTSLQAASGAVISFTLPDYTTLNTAGSPAWTCTAAIPPTPSTCTTTITGPIAAGATGNIALVLNVNTALPAAAAVVTLTPTIAETTAVHDNGTDLNGSNNTGVADTDLIIGVWTGAVSSDMSDPLNWSNNMLPAAGQNISIPADAVHQPVFTGTTTVANLYLSGDLNIGPGGRIIVTSLLSLGSNKITGAGTVEIGAGATITRTTGQINCLLQKDFSNGTFTAGADGAGAASFVAASTFTFPVGDASGFYPVDVTTASTGSLTVSTTQGDAGTVPPLDTSKTLQRYWTLSSTGSMLADLKFTYAGSGIQGTESNYKPQRVTGGNSIAFGDTCGGAACVDQDNDFIFVPNISSFNGNWTASDSPSITTAAEVDVSGRVTTAEGIALRNVRVTLDNGTGHPITAVTNAFGYYHFDAVRSGSTFILGAAARGYTFTPRVVSVTDQITGLDITALP
jgi:VCBS repeat-containing protein